MRKSTHATEELHHLRKQQVLKDAPPRDSPITSPKLNESDKNEGKKGGGYVQEDDRLTRVPGSGGYKVELFVLHDRKVMTCCAICIIPCIPCLPYVTVLFNRPLFTYVKRKLNCIFPHVCKLLAMRWSMEEYFKSHSTDYKKPLEISHWDALECLKSLLKWPMSASLSLESDNKVAMGKTLKHLTKLLDRLWGIECGYDEGMESRSVMVLANGIVHKLREELKDDGAFLFGLIFLAYLDIGGECFCLFFPYFAFMCTLYFDLALAVLSSEPIEQ